MKCPTFVREINLFFHIGSRASVVFVVRLGKTEGLDDL
jgi:hypothetical protein